MKNYIKQLFNQAATNKWDQGHSTWKTNLRAALAENARLLKELPHTFGQKTISEKIQTLGFGWTVAGYAAWRYIAHGNGLDAGSIVSETLGLAGYMTLMGAVRQKNNENRVALMPVAAGFIAPAMAMGDNGLGYTLMIGAMGLRTLTLSHVQPENKILRRGIATGFWLAGASAIALATGLDNPWEISPIISMTLGTLADLVPARYARAGLTTSELLHVGYHSFYTGRFSPLIGHIISTFNGAVNAIGAHDVPKVNESGEQIGRWQGLKLYFKNMVTGRPMPAVDKAQPAIEASNSAESASATDSPKPV